MKVNLFVSSNIHEFSEERKLIKEEISKDPLLGEVFDVYLYEEDSSKSTSADDVFINEVEHSDVYIGLIGSEYGDSYRNGVSATEYEYNAYSSNKTDSYFFVKNVYERDVSSNNFLARISQNHNYKLFNNILRNWSMK